MTVVVAVRFTGGVLVGADSAAISDWDHIARRDTKLFRVGPFVIGYTTSYRMGQLLQYGTEGCKLDALVPTGDGHRFMVTEFVPAVRKILKDAGYATVKDNVESGGHFIVAYGRELFVVHSDFQVIEPFDNVTAIGCGECYALGAAWATAGVSPCEIVKTALEAADKYSAGVVRPFHYLSTEKPERGLITEN